MADDDERANDRAYLLELLKEGDTEWLTELLGDRLAAPKEPPKPKADHLAGPGAGLEAFLRTALEKLEAKHERTQTMLDAALDLLTPEQRTLLRSAGSGKEVDRKAPAKRPQAPPADPPEDQDTTPVKVSRLFKRL